MDPKTILIIEDDADMVEAMKVSLESASRIVSAAYDPESGLKAARRQKPDLIILDVMFGSRGALKGFEYAVKIREDQSLAGIPILMVSAVNQQHQHFNISMKDESDFLPVDGFVDKPADPDDLLLQVEALLKKGQSAWAHWPDRN